MRMSLRDASVVALFLVPFVAAPAMAENKGDGSETYYEDVLPILQENCQTCHREAGLNLSGLLAPMPLMNYEQTRPWARSIARKVETREMPPWFASAPLGVFENERRLTDGEIQTILSWVEAGAPAGDRADAPPAKMFAEQTNDGWSHGTPDFVIQIEEPYTVPDDAYDINVAFRVPLTEANLPEDVVVRGWEIRTGADGSGVHHVCLFAQPGEAGPTPPVSSAADGAPIPLAGLLSCVAEGAESGMLPEGFGLELKTGQTLEFNIHFNKESGAGTAFESQAEAGFFLADESVEHLVFNDSLGNMGFSIPPNQKDYRIGMARTLKKDTLLLNFWPHAHLRATAARYVAYYPDGREELLLDVPTYDQSWQLTYKYKEPKLLPKGTRIEADFWYDNTAARGARRGFDSNLRVGFGPRTNDEMALAFISYVELDDTQTTNQEN